jgi:hypothetical protein
METTCFEVNLDNINKSFENSKVSSDYPVAALHPHMINDRFSLYLIYILI